MYDGGRRTEERGTSTRASVASRLQGEGERAFRELCERLLLGEKPETKVISGHTPPMAELELPYRLYSEEDIAHRVIYVEASRGCPYRCEFCLSSLDRRVRDAGHP